MPLILKVLRYKGQPVPSKIMARFDESGGSIGRSSDNYFVLRDPGRFISRKHANIVFRNGSYFFSDTSTNGTYVINRNLRLLQDTVELRDGDLLKIGDYEIAVSFGELEEPPPPPTPKPKASESAAELDHTHYGIDFGLWGWLEGEKTVSPKPPPYVPDKPSSDSYHAKADEVHLAVSAPRFVKPDSGFIARFAAYVQEREAEVRRKIETANRGGPSEFIPQPEVCRWQLGAPIRVRVIGDCFTAVPAEHSFQVGQVRGHQEFPSAPETRSARRARAARFRSLGGRFS